MKGKREKELIKIKKELKFWKKELEKDLDFLTHYTKKIRVKIKKIGKSKYLKMEIGDIREIGKGEWELEKKN